LDICNKLYAPDEFWNMSENAILEVTGGCGPGKAGGYIVPDRVWGLSIKRACRIHDFMYSDLCDATKEEADRVFLDNMRRLIFDGIRWKWLIRLRLRRAKTYYLFVKYGGGTSVADKG
jgi:hypothetical protein